MRKLFGYIHLWLGLITGIIVFIVCITAAIWEFSPEMAAVIQPYRSMKEQPGNFLSINDLKAIADQAMPKRSAERIDFEGRQKAAIINLSGKGNYKVYINPYDGRILKNM